MNNKYKLWEHWVDFIGFAILALGTLWQSWIGGWWDRTAEDWQWHIQEEVNLTVLDSLDQMSGMIAYPNEEWTSDNAKKVAERTARARRFIIDERDERHYALRKGQAAFVSSITFALMSIGAALIAVGRILAIKAELQPDRVYDDTQKVS